MNAIARYKPIFSIDDESTKPFSYTAQALKKLLPTLPFSLLLRWRVGISEGHDFVVLNEEETQTLIQDRHTAHYAWVVREGEKYSDTKQWLLAWQANGSKPFMVRQKQDETRFYRVSDFLAERKMADWLFHTAWNNTLLHDEKKHDTPSQKGAGFVWSESQLLALRLAKLHRLLILSGGPGSGKTTIVAEIIREAIGQGILTEKDIALCAPSGKAAGRLTEGMKKAGLLLQATTIHRLLGLGYSQRPRYSAQHPMPYKMLVVDECSMIDLSLFVALVSATPPHLAPRVILCGDPDQLSAVLHGAVFGQCIMMGKNDNAGEENKHPNHLPFVAVHLQGNQRASHPSLQSLPSVVHGGSASALIDFLHTHAKIQAPQEPLPIAPLGIVHWPDNIATDKHHAAFLQRVITWMTGYLTIWQINSPVLIPDSVEIKVERALDYLSLHRILCARLRGYGGAVGINHALKKELENVSGQTLTEGLRVEGMALMLTKNHPEYQLSNGDSGVWADGKVWFAGGGAKQATAYPSSLVEDCIGGFAMSIHKSQGSEFSRVLLMLPEGALTLSRSLLYTGITRAKEGLILCASEQALTTSINRQELRRCAIRPND